MSILWRVQESKAQTVFIGFSKSEIICASSRAISMAVGKQPNAVLVNVNNWFSCSMYRFCGVSLPAWLI